MKTKTTIIAVLSYLFTIFILNGGISFHVVLEPDAEDDYADIQASISEDSKNEDYVNIIIPYPEYLSCWLIITKEEIDQKSLNFRKLIWDRKIPNFVKYIIPLSEEEMKFNGENIKMGVVIFKIKKSSLNKTYVYCDHPSDILDGGYYYTYNLAKYPITKQKAKGQQ